MEAQGFNRILENEELMLGIGSNLCCFRILLDLLFRPQIELDIPRGYQE